MRGRGSNILPRPMSWLGWQHPPSMPPGRLTAPGFFCHVSPWPQRFVRRSCITSGYLVSRPFERERSTPEARRFSREGVVKRRGSPGAGRDLHALHGTALRYRFLFLGYPREVRGLASVPPDIPHADEQAPDYRADGPIKRQGAAVFRETCGRLRL